MAKGQVLLDIIVKDFDLEPVAAGKGLMSVYTYRDKKMKFEWYFNCLKVWINL